MICLYICVCLHQGCVCVCVCARVHVCTCVCLKALGWCQESFLITLPHWSLKQGLAIKPECIDMADLSSQLALRTPPHLHLLGLEFQGTKCQAGIHVDSEGLQHSTDAWSNLSSPSFCFSKNYFILSSFLKDSLMGHSVLGWNFVIVAALLTRSPHYLLAFKFPAEKSVGTVMKILSHVIGHFSFYIWNVLFDTLIIACFGKGLGLSLMGFFDFHGSGYQYLVLILGKFSNTILLNILPMPLSFLLPLELI